MWLELGLRAVRSAAKAGILAGVCFAELRFRSSAARFLATMSKGVVGILQLSFTLPTRPRILAARFARGLLSFGAR